MIIIISTEIALFYKKILLLDVCVPLKLFEILSHGILFRICMFFICILIFLFIYFIMNSVYNKIRMKLLKIIPKN